ncbi:hypothetical protein A2W14_06275 [Candidatus Gottesmanbacteria bacterium RBG_16_37_8]|uniref:Membrane protein 6-pyruvoyl-tetrahydropterin synthase-related domain-containing protein n=1 Tax=Candidatus Gottesmanbacteria bacterium RBG_16_37_8 TaxID=1798371 RepID=A0A1F5YWB0_9BACT|nr:MAG: hypothetical protein A2W14_06275 [Candidatus Gottesmanbacteria bacterium RBG_16_37_8]
MNTLKKYLALIILAFAIIFNLILYRAEVTIKGDPNDNIFQYSLVHRTNWVWENYGCPLSLQCLPNLVDHNVTYWAEGYALPFYYSHLPQITIVASYKLLVSPVASFARHSLGDGGSFTLYQYYNWTKYLLLSLIPLPFFLAFIIVGFPIIPSAIAAFFASHLSTDGLYGIDPPSSLWRGWGLTSQLYAVIFMPLALAFTFKAAKKITATANSKITNLFHLHPAFWAVVFLTLTTAGHLGIGIITLLSTTPLIFLDLNKTNIISRIKQLFLIYISLILVLSYWIIPILLYNNYHIVSFWDPIWKFNSYGWFEVIRQYLNGEIFDWQRLPLVTSLVTLGFFVLLLHKEYLIFAYIFALMMLFYFGRTTWGGLIDLIPGMKDFHLHRFIVGVHATSLFLLPLSIEFLFSLTSKITSFFQEKIKKTKEIQAVFPWISPIFNLILISVIAYLTVNQTVKYNALNHRWISEANSAYSYDEKNFLDLLDFLKEKPQARIYAGRPGNWGHDFRLGSSQIYMLLSVYGFDMSQFLPETWSMMSENDQNFDERYAMDYNLLNLRYIIAPKNQDFPQTAQMVKKFGPYQVYEIPTSGWFDVVESPMFVESDKTNFLNLVYLWHRSYPRTWKMHPLISVEKNPSVPPGMKKQIKMIDEVTYRENNRTKNIFADFPFVFPEATVSAKISQEKVNKQTYSAKIDVPKNCRNCVFMFKMSYHPNWNVVVDGKQVEKYAVFPMYVAAKAKPGSHTIEVTHQPHPLKTFLLYSEILAIPLLFIFRKKLTKSPPI